MKRLLLFALLAQLSICLNAQAQKLTYYLPDIEYDENIPTPEAFLGYQIGEWHISHDQQLAYMKELARLSPRITLTTYARSYEHRPLVYLTITSESNHQNLPQLRERHLQVSDPSVSSSLNLQAIPAVLYQGFSIHGNEPSGGNAAPLVAYYLAAAKSPEVERLLNEVIILFDPCYNPDGFHRFSSWANMHKNLNLTGDPQDREYDEVWPRGRTNHYWFDLNRDWLPVQHPESQGRIRTFHEWKPNVLTDHHEMGTNSTFFFMPGVPQRTHPLTPWRNQELTGSIGTFHQKALDEIGSLYYTQEGYDDFYMGKGSTYPDANGCIGILFEQASSRGHLQHTENGDLSFPFTIRNQVATALSTHKAILELGPQLLDFQRDFYKTAMDEARKDRRKAYIFGDSHDQSRVDHLVEILRRHQVKVYELKDKKEINGISYEPGTSFLVPMEQTQYRLIRAMFETMTTFEDSIFYDVSTWTLPLSFNIRYTTISASELSGARGEEITGLRPNRNNPALFQSEYAYLMPWDDYYAPKALNTLLKKGLRVKVATRPLEFNNKTYKEGTIMIPAQNQETSVSDLFQLLTEIASETGVTIDKADTGWTPAGIDFGSRDFEPVDRPRVLLLVGDGVSSYDAGEVWHLLDQRFGMEVVMAEANNLSRLNLQPYNRIVMVDGRYSGIGKNGASALKGWLQDGGTLIAMKRAAQWAESNGLSGVRFKKSPDKVEAQRPYSKMDDDYGSEVIGGAIFETIIDLTHPLAYGFQRAQLPSFRRGTLFFEIAKNPYATPMKYSNAPLLSGYIKKDNLRQLSGSAVVVVSSLGSGRVINMADNPNFRAFWFGTNKIFMNALFFGNLINGGACEPVSRKTE